MLKQTCLFLLFLCVSLLQALDTAKTPRGLLELVFLPSVTETVTTEQKRIKVRRHLKCLHCRQRFTYPLSFEKHLLTKHQVAAKQLRTQKSPKMKISYLLN